MNDLVVALGLALVLEGVAWALFPERMRYVVSLAAAAAPGALRSCGLILALVGVFLVWLIRG